MDFLLLSLPEATYLYFGLAIQALVRASPLRHLPWILVLVGTMRLLLRLERQGGAKDVVLYLLLSLALTILFWPECSLIGGISGQPTTPDQVASYAALQDPDATVVTAGSTNQVPESLRNPALVPPGFRLLLRVVTETPLALARVINSQAHRTFASVMPMAWYLDVKLTADMTTAVADWTHSCYTPTLLAMAQEQAGRTIDDLLPFGETPLHQRLAERSVTPGAQTGITWISGPNANNVTRCDVYLSALEFQAQNWLSTLKSPKGTPYLELFEQELGLDGAAQGALLLYREMLYAAGPGVPAPSLQGYYAALRSGSLAVDTIGGAGSALLKTWDLKATGWGALTGLVSGVGGDIQRGLEGLSWLVRIAMIAVWYGPYIMGIINLILVGLFPIVLLWSLIPGTQFQAIAQYFLALLFTSSTPLYWALVDQAARLAAQQPPVVDGGMGALWSAFIYTGMWNASIIALGILLIPLVVGLLYFAAFRAVGNLWKGGM
jgi:hypothetical protein